MSLNRKKTTNKGTTSEITMLKAALLCLDENMSQRGQRSIAEDLNICHVSLNRYIKKFKLHRETGCPITFGYQPHNKIFDDFQEKQLADFIKNSADMYFGSNLKNVRKLAFEFAIKLNLKVPKNWTNNEEAGSDWFTDFLKRNPSLSIRRPEATSL